MATTDLTSILQQLMSGSGGDNTQYTQNQWGEMYYTDPETGEQVRAESNGGDQQWGAGAREALEALYSKYGLDPSMMRSGGEEMTRPTEINGGLYVPVAKGYFDPHATYDGYDPAIAQARAAARQNLYIDPEGNTWAKPQDVLQTNQMIAPHIPQGLDFFAKYGPLIAGLGVALPAAAGAFGGGSVFGGAGLGGGSLGGIGGGAGGAGLGGLSAETAAWLASAGYTPAEIATLGAQFGAGGALTGIGADAISGAYDPFGDPTNAAYNPSGAAGNPFEGATIDGGTSNSIWDSITNIPGGATSALGKLLGAGLGAYASNKQAGALNDLASRYEGYGAPSRARYEASFAPGFTMANDPGFTDSLNQASKSNLHALSLGGNPAFSPNAQAQNMQDLYQKNAYPALQSYRSGNANSGGLATFNAAAPQVATNAVNSNSNMYNAIGGGIADVFSPPKTGAQTLAELLKSLKV